MLRTGLKCRVQTMVKMVVNQRFLRSMNSAFDGLQLLHDVKARSTVVEHRDDVLQVPPSALEAIDDFCGDALLPWGYPTMEDIARALDTFVRLCRLRRF